MSISILLRTTNYRGDHEAEVSVAHELAPGETVEALAERLLWKRDYKGRATELNQNDWIEIRIVVAQAASQPSNPET